MESLVVLEIIVMLEILYVMEFLLRNSDEEHPVSINQIADYL